MINALKFVKGAINKKNNAPEMRHYHIKNQQILAHNGVITLSAPIPLNIDCSPKADLFYYAIDNCTETAQFSLTAGGKLSVKSGKFRALIECLTDPFPQILPTGNVFELDGEKFISALEILYPFIAESSPQAWANGLLMRNNSLYATNNIILIQYWLGYGFDIDINIPRIAIKELLRLKQIPRYLQIDSNSITFHFDDNKWLKSSLIEIQWPNVDKKILDYPGSYTPIPPDFFTGIETIKKFCDSCNRIYFFNNLLAVSEIPGDSTGYECPGITPGGIYNVEMLLKLDGVALAVDWSFYPKPCLFIGENLRGAIVGLHQ